jgi:hypothetical protein
LIHPCDAQQLEAERKEKDMLESKIKAMESKVLQGGVNLLEKVRWLAVVRQLCGHHMNSACLSTGAEGGYHLPQQGLT